MFNLYNFQQYINDKPDFILTKVCLIAGKGKMQRKGRKFSVFFYGDKWKLKEVQTYSKLM